MSIRAITTVWEKSQAKGSVLLLLLAIADYAHDDCTEAYPSMETLAKKTRMSVQNVIRLVKEAEESGELSVKRGGGRGNPNHYAITLGGNTKKISLKDSKKTLTNSGETLKSPLVQPLDRTVIIEPVCDSKNESPAQPQNDVVIQANPELEHDFDAMPSASEGMPPLGERTAGVSSPHCEQQEMVAALHAVTLQPPQTNGGKLGKTASNLLKVPGVTPAKVREWYGENGWYYLHDWRGLRGQPPSIAAINETVQMARDGRETVQPNRNATGKQPLGSKWEQINRVILGVNNGNGNNDPQGHGEVIEGVPVKTIFG